MPEIRDPAEPVHVRSMVAEGLCITMGLRGGVVHGDTVVLGDLSDRLGEIAEQLTEWGIDERVMTVGMFYGSAVTRAFNFPPDRTVLLVACQPGCTGHDNWPPVGDPRTLSVSIVRHDDDCDDDDCDCPEVEVLRLMLTDDELARLG